MFNFSPGEVLCVAAVALIVLGPEKLPEAAEKTARFLKKLKGAKQELTQKIDTLLEEDK